MVGQSQVSARWVLSEPLDLDWRGRASCRDRMDLPWTPEEAPASVFLVQMRVLCEGCPVRRRCADYGLSQPGGFYGGVWVPWAKDGARPGDEGSQGSRLAARNALRWVRDSATTVGDAPTVKDDFRGRRRSASLSASRA